MFQAWKRFRKAQNARIFRVTRTHKDGRKVIFRGLTQSQAAKGIAEALTDMQTNPECAITIDRKAAKTWSTSSRTAQ